MDNIIFEIVLIFAGAAVLALAFTRFPRVAEAARQADTGQGTKDLFLTLTMLDRCAGDYKQGNSP